MQIQVVVVNLYFVTDCRVHVRGVDFSVEWRVVESVDGEGAFVSFRGGLGLAFSV
jgi:hypothetical protein